MGLDVFEGGLEEALLLGGEDHDALHVDAEAFLG